MSDFEDETGSEPAEPAEDEPGEFEASLQGTDDEISVAHMVEATDENLEQFSEAVGEKRAKQLEGLNKHVTRRLGEIFGDDAVDLVPCPVCAYWSMPGWIPPVELPDEVRAIMQHLLGQHAASDYKRDNYSHICEECYGLGETRSGSKKPGYELVVCIPCGGKGWVAVGPERGGPLQAVPNSAPAHVTLTSVPDAPQYAPRPEKTPEVLALEGAGYTVIPPWVPVGQ